MFCYILTQISENKTTVIGVFESFEDCDEYIDVLDKQGFNVNELYTQKCLYVPHVKSDEKFKSTYVK